MSDLSDFQRPNCRSQVGPKHPNYSKGTVSKLLTTPDAYTQRGKTSSVKHSSGRKQKLSEKNRWVLKRICMSKGEQMQQKGPQSSITIWILQCQ
ncbi:hypothetical protein TNCV_3729661 [Trichonephila clavipes]|nr:hypothetical protein TNCV_3729661 [Trichonephila clavipes]